MQNNKKFIGGMSIIVIVCLSLTLFFFLKKTETLTITCEGFNLVYPDNWEHKRRPGPGKYPWHLFFMKSKRNMRDQPTIDIYRLEKIPSSEILKSFSSPVKLSNGNNAYDLSTVATDVKTPFVTFKRLIHSGNKWIGFKYVTYTRDKKINSFAELPEDVKNIANSIKIEKE